MGISRRLSAILTIIYSFSWTTTSAWVCRLVHLFSQISNFIIRCCSGGWGADVINYLDDSYAARQRGIIRILRFGEYFINFSKLRSPSVGTRFGGIEIHTAAVEM